MACQISTRKIIHFFRSSAFGVFCHCLAVCESTRKPTGWAAKTSVLLSKSLLVLMKQWNNSVVNWWMFLLGISLGYRETKKNTGIQQWCRVAGAMLDDYDIIITDSSLELTQLKSNWTPRAKKMLKEKWCWGWLRWAFFKKVLYGLFCICLEGHKSTVKSIFRAVTGL